MYVHIANVYSQMYTCALELALELGVLEGAGNLQYLLTWLPPPPPWRRSLYKNHQLTPLV